MPITAIEGLQQLSQHPRTFLKSYLLLIGQFPGGSDVRTVKFQTSGFATGLRHGRVLGSLRTHEAQDCAFMPAVNMGYQSVDVNVQFVQMYAFTNVAGIQWHTLAGAGSPNIMITTKLTGCSFLVRTGPMGQVACAHIQPNQAAVPPQTGEALRSDLANAHAGNHARLFGRGRTGLSGYEAAEAATVVGVRRNNSWNIYAQRLVAGQQTFKDVERIFPA